MLFFTMPSFDGDFPEKLRPQEYKKYKNALADKFISDYEKVTGMDIKSHIEEISVSTPVTPENRTKAEAKAKETIAELKEGK